MFACTYVGGESKYDVFSLLKAFVYDIKVYIRIYLFLLNYTVGAPVDGVFTDPLVTCLWSNPRASSFQPSGIFLNFYQKQAMKVALTKRFYLIQGPPGTQVYMYPICIYSQLLHL